MVFTFEKDTEGGNEMEWENVLFEIFTIHIYVYIYIFKINTYIFK